MFTTSKHIKLQVTLRCIKMAFTCICKYTCVYVYKHVNVYMDMNIFMSLLLSFCLLCVLVSRK